MSEPGGALVNKKILGVTTRRWVWIATWLVQAAVCVLGVVAIDSAGYDYMWAWCGVGTVFALAIVTTLAITAHHGRREPVGAPHDPRVRRLFIVIAWAVTLVPALIGAIAAVTMIATPKDERVNGMTILVVWTILLAWGYLQWGFAQVYLLMDYPAGQGAFRFPCDHTPGVVDYVYLSFTLGTSFAVSDVESRTPLARWIITIQSVLSFFFNGVIIAVAFQTLSSLGG